MKRIVILALCLFLLAFFLPALYFYQGWYQPEPAPRPNPAELSLPTQNPLKPGESPVPRAGTLLIDRAHDNQFAPGELSLFIQRALSRGYRIDYLEGKGQQREEELRARLEEKLRLADTFAIFVPRTPFLVREGEAVRDFVNKGGKLLLIADPTRRSEINSLANPFGMTFGDDYLYNLKENDGNFRNVFVSRFKPGDLTRGLNRIALYSASSVSPSGWGLAQTDENTFSNVLNSTEPFSPMIVSPDNRVLAIADLSFLQEPFVTAYDNSALLSNLVEWLTLSQRTFPLTDFPHFFKGKVGIEFADPKFIDQGLRLRNLLEGRGRGAELSEFKGGGGGGVFLGLLTHAGKVKAELEAGGIAVTTEGTPTVKIEGLGQVYKPEVSLLYLSKQSPRLFLLADKEEGLKQLVDGLETGDFRQWLAGDNLALRYPKPKPEEKK